MRRCAARSRRTRARIVAYLDASPFDDALDEGRSRRCSATGGRPRPASSSSFAEERDAALSF